MEEQNVVTTKMEFNQLLQKTYSIFCNKFGIIAVGFIIVSLIAMIYAVFGGILLALLSPKSSAMDFKAIILSSLPLLMILGVVGIVVCIAPRCGWLSILCKLSKGEEAKLGEFTAALNKFPNLVLLEIIRGLAIGVALLLFIVPGVFLAIRWSLASYLVIDKGLGPIEALGESWKLVQGFSWQILGYILLCGVASILFNFIPIVGFLGQMAVNAYYELLLAVIYRLRGGELVG